LIPVEGKNISTQTQKLDKEGSTAGIQTRYKNISIGSSLPKTYLTRFKNLKHFKKTLTSYLIPTANNSPIWATKVGNGFLIALDEKNYEYIFGGRLKNESKKIKQQILDKNLIDGDILKIRRSANTRLIVTYANNRAAKDEHNRKRGLQRLEKQIKSGKLTKSSINNKGYNKYLKLEGEISIKIDYEKFSQDNAWDGLKGYITNTKISDRQVIENYKNLWHIEKAFRMSKTDLRIRPIYHRLRHRIEAHICISFTAYSVYKELERILYKEKSNLSIKKAAELTYNMYQITYTLPESKHTKTKLLKMDQQQAQLYQIIEKNF
jgi:hypothetical protein